MAWHLTWISCGLLAFAWIPACGMAAAAPLVLEHKVALGHVNGRIDHLAVDLPRQRLFVAELGNGTVGVIDLKQSKVVTRLRSFAEPQGLAYHAVTDTLYVANGGDGTVRLFSGSDLTPRGQIDLRDDADNVRIDSKGERLLIGYGRGGLALIDPVKRAPIADVKLGAHPEGFQLDDSGKFAYVNLPAARKLAIVDLAQGRVTLTVRFDQPLLNYPMAVDHDAQRILTVFRRPPKLLALNTGDGSVISRNDVCGDSDDVFVDAKRRRAYVSCGEGFVDVFDRHDSGYRRVGHIATVAGSRTSLWVPELDRLFLAVRAGAGQAAAIWVFRPEQ